MWRFDGIYVHDMDMVGAGWKPKAKGSELNTDIEKKDVSACLAAGLRSS